MDKGVDVSRSIVFKFLQVLDNLKITSSFTSNKLHVDTDSLHEVLDEIGLNSG